MIGKLRTNVDVTCIGYSIPDTEKMLSERSFERVCVETPDIRKATERGFKVSTVVAFPFGRSQNLLGEIENAILMGTHEIDIAIPCRALFPPKRIRNNIVGVSSEMKQYLEDLVLPPSNRIEYKFILHTDLMEKLYSSKAQEMAIELASMIRTSVKSKNPSLKDPIIKTCTGYGPGSANLGIVKALCDNGFRVKASGGIRTLDQASLFFEAGAEVLGIGYRSFSNIMDEARNS